VECTAIASACEIPRSLAAFRVPRFVGGLYPRLQVKATAVTGLKTLPARVPTRRLPEYSQL